MSDDAPQPSRSSGNWVFVALLAGIFLTAVASNYIGFNRAPDATAAQIDVRAANEKMADFDANMAATKAPRFDPSRIEAARAAIAAEPKVIDLLFDESNVVEWHVAVADDGSKRYGYAGYICLLVREHGAYDENVEVRIVDAAKRAEFGDAYRDYSLGAIRCVDNTHFD